MRHKNGYLFGVATGALLCSGSVSAGEAVVYTYDELGRLIAVASSGTVNNGVSTALGYDAAGNRTSYLAGGAPSPSPSPTPTPTPTPTGNLPPVAVSDSGGMTWCVAKDFAVLANDSDPDGNIPLALVSVSGGGTRGTPTIVGTNVHFEATGVTGTAALNYVMRDNLGATATAQLSISITNGACGPAS